MIAKQITTERHFEIATVALCYINEHWREQPSLLEIANAIDCDLFHLQRIFSLWTGLSPKKITRFLTLEDAKNRLRNSQPVLDAAIDSGLSSPGRLHDLFVDIERMSPGQYKNKGAGLNIIYQFIDTPFGEALILETDLGLCGIAFTLTMGRSACLSDMQSRWPKACYIEGISKYQNQLNNIFSKASSHAKRQRLAIHLMGTNFQIKVWEALMRIPPSCLTTYGDLCQTINMDKTAARALGTAVGANPISWLIPCHRVIRKTGWLGGYRWGLPCKIAMLGWEKYRANQVSTIHI